MARKKKAQQETPSFGDFKTVYLDFSEKERIEIIELIKDQTNPIISVIEEGCDEGWKISISHSSGWGNFVCSITPKDVPDYPKNLVFMFRHSDFTRVVGFLRFFFGVMIPNGDSRLQGEIEDTSW